MKISIKKRASLLGFIFILFFLGSLVAIGYTLFGNTFHAFPKAASDTAIVADIYQNGKLLQQITLNSTSQNDASEGSTSEAYTISFTAPNGGINIVEVRSDSIGILSADCPDQLCVKQGFISSSLLPITCLPHRLVIQIRTVCEPDMITY